MSIARCGRTVVTADSSFGCKLPRNHDGDCYGRALLFIGECRSLTAKRKNWTWRDGRLAAKPLFEALRAMGVDPAQHDYVNLWTDAATPIIPPARIARLRRDREDGVELVALGKRVSGELAKRGIEHGSRNV